MSLRLLFTGLVVGGVALSPSSAFACPLCESGTAEEVRTGLVASALAPATFLGLSLPFALIGLLLVWMNMGPRERNFDGH